ncbi:MAG: glycerol-3-phosphate 1-O-acyltransferase PlsY [Chloroflexi bacterium]|nr:glycerol-3-phosphate 1-O-acyltransferase PlsY [Chloroflexota bacterium]
MIVAKFVAVLIFAYLVGAIPFGVLIGRRFARVDVRDYGSGKMGATNVARVAGKKVGLAVMVMDLLKGVIAVGAAWVAYRGGHWVFAGSWEWWLVRSAPILAALAAMAGHNWPVFLNFRGGRGVATFFGGLAALCPPVALLGGQITLLSVGLTRYVSLGSIAGTAGTFAILLPLTILNGFPVEYLIYSLIGTIAIIVTHRDNIARLLAGTERRFGEKALVEDSPQTNKNSG